MKLEKIRKELRRLRAIEEYIEQGEELDFKTERFISETLGELGVEISESIETNSIENIILEDFIEELNSIQKDIIEKSA